MKSRKLLQVVSTILVIGAATLLGRALWNRYMNSPWTRDGRVCANVIQVAPDVSGIVVRVVVGDNQAVHKGDLLFTVDQKRYQLALNQAKALLAASKAEMGMRQQQAERRARLGNVAVSAETQADAHSQADSARAMYQKALVAVATAKLNLRRTEVRSPVDGFITNLNVHPGDFATRGEAKLAVIDRNSFWVYGYFEETKLHLLHRGAPVDVQLLGYAPVLQGHIESLAHGIADHDNHTSRELLSDVNPMFNWVRLAQRIPVRIKIDRIPADLPLAAGMTCTVIARPESHKQATALAANPTPD